MFLEHPPTITAGVNSQGKNLLFPAEVLQRAGVEYLPVARGGDHTGHEPGQLVVYFHIDLTKRKMGVGDFLGALQASTAELVDKTWGISLVSDRERPGLYWEDNPEKKIVSLGVYFKSFFTSFGMALNLSNSGEVFRYINPCGIQADSMQSLSGLGADAGLREEFIHLFIDNWKNLLEKKYPPIPGKKSRQSV